MYLFDSIKLNTLDNYFKLSVLAMVLTLAIVGVYTTRGLYADGSFFLYNILLHKDFWAFDTAREFVQILNQTPVVWSINLGENDLNALIYWHSVGLIAVPLVIWFWAFSMHMRSNTFWVLVLAFSVSYQLSGFFAIGEYNLTYALVAYCWAVLNAKKVSCLSFIGLIVSSFILIRSYEAMLFLGLLLTFNAIVFWQRQKEILTNLKKALMLAVVLCFLLATVSSLWSVMNPRDAGNLQSATQLAWLLSNEQFVLICFVLVAYLLMQFCGESMRRGVFFLIALASILFLLVPAVWSTPAESYAFRSVSGIMLGFIFVVYSLGIGFNRLLVSSGYQSVLKTNGETYLLIFLFFMTMSIITLVSTIHFSRWLMVFEATVTQTADWTYIDNSQLYHPERLGYDWLWTNPTLSIVLRGDGKAGLMNSKAYDGWQPFEPTSMQGSNQLCDYHKSGPLH